MFLTSVNSRREFLTNWIIPLLSPLFTTDGDERDAPLINERVSRRDAVPGNFSWTFIRAASASG